MFTDANSVEHNRVFNPYASGTQVNSHKNDNSEDKTPGQHIEGINARIDMLDGRQDCDIGEHVPETEIFKSCENGRNGKMKTMSRWMSHRPERLGIDQQ